MRGDGLPDPRATPPGRDVVALCGPLTADLAIAGYRRGLFAMELAAGVNAWFSPDPRGVLPLPGLRVSRSLRRSLGRFAVTTDTAFEAVLEACADPGRPGAWINDEYRRVYRVLHARGAAHSVEVWRGDLLAGGLIGVEQGGLFCGETMFHRHTDASKVALVALVGRLAASPGPGRLLDVQWWTPHLGSLGVVEMSRDDYLDRLPQALRLPPAWRP